MYPERLTMAPIHEAKAPVHSQVRLLDVGDLAEMAAIHRRAFPGSALTCLGLEAVRRYYKWQMVGPHASVTIGVLHNGKLVGFLVGGTFNGAFGGYIRREKVFLVAMLLCHPWVLLSDEARSQVPSVLHALRRKKCQQPQKPKAPDTKQKTCGVLAIAVDPDCRRAGVGSQLMRHFEKYAIERGSPTIDLTVHMTNTVAISFYEHVGWKHGSITGPNSLQMVKDLPTTPVE